MAVVGFSFIKMLAERKKAPTEAIKINSDVKVTNVVKDMVGKEENLARFEFEFTLNYGEPGELLLTGEVLFMDEPAKVKQIIENWKKQQAVEAKILTQVLNAVLYRANIKALELMQEVGLPSHINLPKFVEGPAPSSQKPAS